MSLIFIVAWRLLRCTQLAFNIYSTIYFAHYSFLAIRLAQAHENNQMDLCTNRMFSWNRREREKKNGEWKKEREWEMKKGKERKYRITLRATVQHTACVYCSIVNHIVWKIVHHTAGCFRLNRILSRKHFYLILSIKRNQTENRWNLTKCT